MIYKKDGGRYSLKEKKNLVLRIVLTGLTALFVAWIYSNSLKNAEQSTEQSGKVLLLLRDIFAFLFPKSDLVISMHFVRKAAHFCEYALLGFLLFYTLKSYFLKTPVSCASAFGIATAVAFSDEGLQFLSEGRAPALLDVGIDSLGALCGVAVAFIIFIVAIKIIEKRKKKQEQPL